MSLLTIEQASILLRQNKVLAYPTEAVFGLGCCAHSETALQTLLEIKARSLHKGLILIASTFDQLQDFVETKALNAQQWKTIWDTWPGPYTWVFPAKKSVRPEITGSHSTVAVRVTAHPIAKQLCEAFGGALVSTSANRAHEAPLRTAQAVLELFLDNIAGVVEGEVGHLAQPTIIQNALTGERYR